MYVILCVGYGQMLARPALPRDFASVIELVRDPEAHVRTVVCRGERDDSNPFPIVPALTVSVALLRHHATGTS